MKNKTKQKMKVEELWRISQSEIIVNSFIWINKNLFKKYCQSQNYYYTRDVNEILRDASSKAVVRYKDWIGYDDDDEYLKRYYYYEDEYPQKIQLLTEYYKFHTDIPRIFMEPIILLLNKYYDKKRRYEYYRIARLIEEENKKNPNGPPKCIIGEGPSPANSQESQKNQESQTQIQRIRNTQILKDLSWLNKSLTQIQKKGIDKSCTLQQICKQLGKVAMEQSSLLISSEKGDEMQLDKFLSYLNEQSQKIQRDKMQQIQKYSKKLSQPHEQLVQTLIQKQHHDDVTKQRFGSQHFIQKTELIQQKNKISSDININLINNQVDTLQKNKLSNHTRMDQNDQIKQSINSKSKTIVQPKISTQLFLKENVQSIPQLLNYQNQNPILSPTQSNAYLQKQTINQISIGKLNLKQISKIFIEDDSTQQELKQKNGAQTHRPNSGTKNFFSNRNSPTVQRGTQNELRTNVLKQTSGQISAAYSQIQQQQSQKNIKVGGSSTNRKSIQPNIHFRFRSNQDSNNNNNIHQNLQLKQAEHKKYRSEGKLLNSPQLDTHHQFVCLTDRAGQVAQYQNSPKINIQKRVGNGIGTFKNSESPKNSVIKQILPTQVQKQQQRQECFSLQLRKPN